MHERTVPDRYVLITNLDYVIVGTVRTYTHALLVSSGEHPLQRGEIRHQLRGFSTTPSVPTFDVIIPTAEFSLEDAVSHHVIMIRHDDDTPTPFMHGAIMHINGFSDVHLIAGVNSRRGLDIARFAAGTDISEVWRDLECKVAEHWTAPNMMVPQWVPASHVRDAHMGSNWK